MSFRSCVTALLCAGLLLACTAPSPVARAHAEDVLRRLDVAWSDAAAAGDVEAMLAFYADDALLLLPGQPPLVGVDAIRPVMGEMLGDPDTRLSWAPEFVHLGDDLRSALVVSRYRIEAGGEIVDEGKCLEVWRREDDGAWRCRADMIHSDRDPAAEPTAGS